MVKGLCIECGLESVKIARLGGVLVLLSFDDLKKAFPIINFEQEFLHYFSALERWRPGVLNPVQFVRVRCFGLPLHIWSTQTFENICGMFGEVVGVAKETFEKTFLINGRVCIRVEGHKLINEEIMLFVCGNSFSMEVREELPSRDSPAVIMARDDGLF